MLKKILLGVLGFSLLLQTNLWASGGDDDDSEELEFRGTITDIGESSITLNALVLLTDENTEYEDLNSEQASAEVIQVGDYVEVKAIETELGLYAKEVELEDEDSGLPSESGKKPSYSSKKGVKDRSRSRLVAESSVTDGAEANVRSKNRTKENNERQRITSRLFFPLPSSVPAIADENDAAERSFTLEISRAGTLLAICTYEFDQVELDDDTQGAEYKIDIRYRLRKNGRESLASKKGACDIDLLTEGVQLGIPNLKSGDTLEVFWQSDAEQLLFSGSVN